VSANGKIPFDPGLLTTNDYRRLRVALDGKDVNEAMADFSSTAQVMILALRLRDDPTFTWEQAGDVPLGEVFDMTSGEPDPQTARPAEPGGTPRKNGGRSSRKKPTASASAPSSASGTASAAPSTTT
jgi:hypothetical protein